MPTEHLERIIDEADIDRDEKVSYADFVNLFTRDGSSSEFSQRLQTIKQIISEKRRTDMQDPTILSVNR